MSAREADDLDEAMRQGREKADAASKAAEEWGPLDPTLLETADHATAPFPLDVLPPPVAEWVRDSAASFFDPAMLALPVLTYVAAAVGNSREVVTPLGHRQPCLLWLALVGASGSRKSAALQIIGAAVGPICAEIERTLEPLGVWPANAADLDGDANAKPPPGHPGWRLGSITMERAAVDSARNGRGLVLEGDELAGIVQAMSKYSEGADRAFFLSGYDAGAYSYRRQGNNVALSIPRCALTLIGGVQPERVAVLLLGGPSDGLASRFVYAYPPPVPVTYAAVAEPPGPGPLETWLRSLLNLAPRCGMSGRYGPHPVHLVDDAWSRFKAWHVGYDAALLASPEGRLREWRSKAPGRVLRFALVLTMLAWACERADDPPPDYVDDLSMAGALDIEKWADAHAVAVYETAGLTGLESDARVVTAFIRDARLTTFNPNHHRSAPGLRPILREAKRRLAVLERLTDGELLRPAGMRSGHGFGRTRSDYAVNPAVGDVAR